MAINFVARRTDPLLPPLQQRPIYEYGILVYKVCHKTITIFIEGNKKVKVYAFRRHKRKNECAFKGKMLNTFKGHPLSMCTLPLTENTHTCRDTVHLSDTTR